MKPSTPVAIFCVLCIVSGITGSVAVDRHYDKSVSISMHIDNGEITPKSMEIYYGSAPNIFPIQEGFRAELVAADGSSVKKFMVWDPRIQFGDGTSIDAQGPGSGRCESTAFGRLCCYLPVQQECHRIPAV